MNQHAPTAAAAARETPEPKASWLPMMALFMAQVLMSFNVAPLPSRSEAWWRTSAWHPPSPAPRS